MRNVKNTMIDKMLAFVAPHLCFGCGKIGSVLCHHCKYDINKNVFNGCLLCGRPSMSGICQRHEVAYSQAWIVGVRQGVLQHLIGGFKFRNMKASGFVLAELLDRRLPSLPRQTVIVPVPTVSAHVRERGYDHTLLIARHFAFIRHLPVNEHLLGRRHTKTQHLANRHDRVNQAQSAFQLEGTINPLVTYLVIDDVVTTGSTIQGVAQLLIDNGAKCVWVGALARQPLD